MTRLRAPKVGEKLVPVFTSEELSALEKTCQGRTFAQRRDAAIIAVLTATGIRAGELAGIRYDPHDPRRSDLDLWSREITVRGKGGRQRAKCSAFGTSAWPTWVIPEDRKPSRWSLIWPPSFSPRKYSSRVPIGTWLSGSLLAAAS